LVSVFAALLVLSDEDESDDLLSLDLSPFSDLSDLLAPLRAGSALDPDFG